MQQVSRLGRAYRLRALAMKLWRAMLVLQVVQRLSGWSPEKRLKRLEELLRAKEEEVADLREEIARLRKQIEVTEYQRKSRAELEPRAETP
jgi:hypothetical protein